jgi:hypothetical protein
MGKWAIILLEAFIWIRRFRRPPRLRRLRPTTGAFTALQGASACSVFLAPAAYELWWLWQLFAFTRRERFPRARAFWWILIPFYGLYVIYQQFDDLKKGLEGLESPVRFSSAGAISLFIASALAGGAGNRGTGIASLGIFVLSGLLFAAAAFMVQQAANAYQEARYPGRRTQGMTTGEVIATVIGVVVFALAILGAVFGG